MNIFPSTSRVNTFTTRRWTSHLLLAPFVCDGDTTSLSLKLMLDIVLDGLLSLDVVLGYSITNIVGNVARHRWYDPHQHSCRNSNLHSGLVSLHVYLKTASSPACRRPEHPAQDILRRRGSCGPGRVHMESQVATVRSSCWGRIAEAQKRVPQECMPRG